MDAANRLGPGAEAADVSLVYTCESCSVWVPPQPMGFCFGEGIVGWCEGGVKCGFS